MVSLSLTEEFILNYDALPPQFKGWRRYRIEYQSDDAINDIWEETIYLPPTVDSFEIEDYLNKVIENAT